VRLRLSRACAGHAWIYKNLAQLRFDYGNNIRTFAFQQGVKNALRFPGFVPAYIRRFFARAKGRSGGRRFRGSFGYRADSQLVLEMFPHDLICNAGSSCAKRVKFSGTAIAHLLAGLYGSGDNSDWR